ncbi:MAG: TrmH family RNA methyltransferase [Atopobium minutum]|nr:TrmH family RNA methyltransferase [Atopobium minutum]
MFNLVLVEPEIPTNTGNIGRSCVVSGTRLHLIGPLGFSLDDKSLKRAGMAYWQSLDVQLYESWEDFMEQNAPFATPASNGANTVHISKPQPPSTAFLNQKGT